MDATAPSSFVHHRKIPFQTLPLPMVLALLLLLATIPACTGRTVQPPANLQKADTAEAFWRTARSNGHSPKDCDLSLRASMYVAEGHKSARMRLNLWGSTGLPLRLDLHSSIGSPLAYAREDSDAWTIFYPDTNQAYFHHNATRALPALDLPLPFSLRDMALLLDGHGTELLPGTFSQASERPDGGWTFVLQGRINEVAFDQAGNIRTMRRTGPEDAAWTMHLSRYGSPEHPRSPEKITVTMAQDKSARIFLKSLQVRPRPWPENATALNLPEGVVPIPLDGRPSLY